MPKAGGQWGGDSEAADAIQKSALAGKGKQGTCGKQQVDKGSEEGTEAPGSKGFPAPGWDHSS